VNGGVELASDAVRVRCDPAHGMVITEFRDDSTGANALWTRSGFTPATITRRIGLAGAPSIESFMDLFVGGWFEMFPSAGLPGDATGALSVMHGEVARIPWDEVERSDSRLVCETTTLRTPFGVRRTLEVVDSTLRARTDVVNLGGEPVPFLWGQHPCFLRETFRGGRIHMDVASGDVPDPPFDEPNSRLECGPFVWPLAPARTGGAADLSQIPDTADGRHDHILLRPAATSARITAPRLGREVLFEFGDAPHDTVLLWQDFRAPGESLHGAIDTFTLEPSNNPGRFASDAREPGVLDAGTSMHAELSLTWRDLEDA
jgi:galactose mutarotase-like enzyme